MDKIQKLKQEKQYEQYVKEKTPRHNLFLNMCKAFFLGGLICLLGQVIYHYFELRNLSPDECSRWMSLSLILLSVLFTGTGIYQKLAAWGGRRSARADHRIRKFSSCPCHRIQKRRSGIRHRM